MIGVQRLVSNIQNKIEKKMLRIWKVSKYIFYSITNFTFYKFQFFLSISLFKSYSNLNSFLIIQFHYFPITHCLSP
jgi:hypothetical protein